MQALGRAEDVTFEAVGDHHVIAYGDAIHGHGSYRMRWHTVLPGVVARPAITSGSVSNALSPVINASSDASQESQCELHPPVGAPPRTLRRDHMPHLR